MKKIEPRQILIDFDATCVVNNYPYIGDEVDGCVEVLKRLQSAGHSLILFTMRADNLLDEAIEWFRNREIELTSINCNPAFETGSRKVYGHLVIDDHGLGVPLKYDPSVHPKPFVDWYRVKDLLLIKGYL